MNTISNQESHFIKILRNLLERIPQNLAKFE